MFLITFTCIQNHNSYQVIYTYYLQIFIYHFSMQKVTYDGVDVDITQYYSMHNIVKPFKLLEWLLASDSS
jgi:hypothetical protein